MKINKITITAFGMLLLFTGCVGFFKTMETPANSEVTKTKQQKAEDAVEAKIIESFGENGVYKGFKFGELFTLKPKEIVELDQLYELRRELPSLKDNYPNNLDQMIAANDSAIITKKQELRDKKIFVTYELTHIYKITSEKNGIQLYECKFLLFPNYKVKDVKIMLSTDLSNKEDELFYYFIMQYPLYELENTYTTNQKNKKTYAQLNKALESETENKARLLKTILSICKHIRINNDFNETKLSQSLAKEWILKNPNYSEGYKSSTFSDLPPVDKTMLDDNNEEIKIPLGYRLHHQFEHKTKDKKLMRRNFQFQFDLNFVIIDVTEIVPETD
ncbi:MAG: hypothetical protein P8L20_11200 [Flavobacteriales bacterium]|nr:hypothetical protein [Flavobacteriales bacterium]